jgi:hypothetical protein
MLNTSIQKSFIIFSTIFLTMPLCVSKAFADKVVLEDFSSYQVGKVGGDNWKSREDNPDNVYSIQMEKNDKYLQAHSKKDSSQLFRKRGWDIDQNPVLSWKWRANEFPKDAEENVGLNDSVAGVYVVFPNRWFQPETIKYIWSEKLPVGKEIKRNKRYPLLVIRSGSADKGKWVTEERNVMEDYKMLFGRSASSPIAFGFLTDSNDTKSESRADYDDFVVLKEKTIKPLAIGLNLNLKLDLNLANPFLQ